jgi:hypothetical protein
MNDEDLWVQLDVEIRRPVLEINACVYIWTARGVNVMAELMSDTRKTPPGTPGRYRLRCHLPPVLTPGSYAIGVWLGTAYDDLDWRERVLKFAVEGDLSHRPDRLVALGLQWQVEPAS